MSPDDPEGERTRVVRDGDVSSVQWRPLLNPFAGLLLLFLVPFALAMPVHRAAPYLLGLGLVLFVLGGWHRSGARWTRQGVELWGVGWRRALRWQDVRSLSDDGEMWTLELHDGGGVRVVPPLHPEGLAELSERFRAGIEGREPVLPSVLPFWDVDLDELSAPLGLSRRAYRPASWTRWGSVWLVGTGLSVPLVRGRVLYVLGGMVLLSLVLWGARRWTRRQGRVRCLRHRLVLENADGAAVFDEPWDRIEGITCDDVSLTLTVGERERRIELANESPRELRGLVEVLEERRRVAHGTASAEDVTARAQVHELLDRRET